MRNQGVLLCTFVDAEVELDAALDYVNTTYSPPRVFVLGTTDRDDTRFALTFNVDEQTLKQVDLGNEPLEMIRVHRNSGTNTLFTLNALNAIKGNGDIVNWQKHRNSIITTHKGRLRHFHTRLNSIINK